MVQGQKISPSTTTSTIAPVQNGTVVTQTPGAPIVIPQGVSPGIAAPPASVGNVGYQVPGNVTVPHPPNSVKSVPMLAPQGKLPMAHPHRTPVPINALPGGKPVMKEVNIVSLLLILFPTENERYLLTFEGLSAFDNSIPDFAHVIKLFRQSSIPINVLWLNLRNICPFL